MSQDLTNESAPVGATASRPNRLLMVAIDATEQAMWAVQVAAELAEPLAADIVLVHVMNAKALGASELAFTERELAALMRQRADEIFASARTHVPPNLRVQRLLREGEPASEIIASASEWEADLLIIGTHGRGRLATFLLGSTAEAVIRGARCPVVTVSHDPRGGPPSIDSGSVGLPAMAL